MAQERVSFFSRTVAFLREACSLYNTKESKTTEETDGKESFYYKLVSHKCSRCGCEVDADSEITLKDK
jgi:hypothetical protein